MPGPRVTMGQSAVVEGAREPPDSEGSGKAPGGRKDPGAGGLAETGGCGHQGEQAQGREVSPRGGYPRPLVIWIFFLLLSIHFAHSRI